MRKMIAVVFLIVQLLSSITLSSSAPTFTYTATPGQANTFNLDISCETGSCSLDTLALSGAIPGEVPTGPSLTIVAAAINQQLPVVGTFFTTTVNKKTSYGITFSQNSKVLATYTMPTPQKGHPLTPIAWFQLLVDGKLFSPNVYSLAQQNGTVIIQLKSANAPTATPIITIPYNATLTSLKVISVDGDSTQMNPYPNQSSPWEWNILTNQLKAAAAYGGGVILGIITDGGNIGDNKKNTRLAFQCGGPSLYSSKYDSNYLSATYSYWVGLSLPTTLTSIEYTTSNDPQPKTLQISSNIFYIVQQNQSNSISVPTTPWNATNPMPNFIYIDVPTEFWGLKDIDFNGIQFSSVQGNNFGLLQQELNMLRLGQEISGTLFGATGIYLPYIGGFGFVGSTYSSLTAQLFLTNLSTQPALITISGIKAGDQIVFRKMEPIDYLNHSTFSHNWHVAGQSLLSFTAYDDLGNASILNSEDFSKLQGAANAINVPVTSEDRYSCITSRHDNGSAYNGSVIATFTKGNPGYNITFTTNYNYVHFSAGSPCDRSNYATASSFFSKREAPETIGTTENLINLKAIQFRNTNINLTKIIFPPHLFNENDIVFSQGTTDPYASACAACYLHIDPSATYHEQYGNCDNPNIQINNGFDDGTVAWFIANDCSDQSGY